MFTISTFHRFISFSIFLILLILIKQSQGQFSVVSTFPAHGDTNVDTAATFSITFNAAIDTSARFPYPGEFYLNLYFYPDSLVGEPDTITVSPDLRTVFVHNLHLSLNTTYLFVLVDAVSQEGGDSLDMPYSFVFTTASSLPTATVSGTISYPGKDPTGSVVALLDGNLFGIDGGNAVNGAVVPSASGAYTVDFVEAGTYWPIVIQNFFIDEYGELDLQPGSAFGFYDTNGDGSPDSIEVTSGATISNVDITLFEVIPQTARESFSAIETLAQAWGINARLVRLGGDGIEPNGSSLFWQYAFYSPSLMQHRGWLAIGNLVGIIELDTTVTDTTALPANWLNSDTIMTVAEANGGSQFRQEHSDADASAFLGQLSFGDDDNGSLSLKLNSPIHRNLFSKERKIFSGKDDAYFGVRTYDQFNELPAVWGVQYYSDSAGVNLFLIIDAVSGELLSEPTTAAVAEQKALPLAQSWAADAKLWSVGNHSGEGFYVDSLGRTDFWACFYYSPSLDSLYVVIVWGQLPTFEGPIGGVPDTTTVSSGWLDSDVCIAGAEAAGGAAYRSNNQNVLVNAGLSRWYFGPNPELTIWRFEYTSSNAPPLEIMVNAITGNVITGIDKPDPLDFPDRFILYQNYPNPFNPVTLIKYSLPTSGQVTIKIYDLLGREVATLVDGYKTAGYHSLTFDGSDLASGIYIYRMKAHNYLKSRKMILLK